MARIGIIGLGNWGTALAKVWCDDGHNVMGWTIEQEVYESIMTENINKKYLPHTKISDLQATMQIEDITTDCEIIVLAIPSGIILSVVDQIIPYLRPSHLLIDLAKSLNARILVRGLRVVSDFEYEFQMLGMNRTMDPNIETVFLMAEPQNQPISSNFVKDIARLGGDISKFTSVNVANKLKESFQ